MAHTPEMQAIIRHIPMNYLQRHDAPGATGPTDALNVEAAMRDYADDRWDQANQLIALKKVNGALLEALETLMGWCKAWDVDFVMDDEWPADEAKIKAAIALAKGEQTNG